MKALLRKLAGFLPATRKQLLNLQRQITMNQAEAVQALNAVKTQQEKTLGEIRGVQTEVTALKDRVRELEEAAGSEVSAELSAAIQAVKDQAQVVDDAIPDVPAPPPADETQPA